MRVLPDWSFLVKARFAGALLIALSGPGIAGCFRIWEKVVIDDLGRIKERGTLRVITAYSANSYFLYRGEPMGYEYELVKELCDHLGVRLEIIRTRDMDNIAYMLNSARGDLIASNLIVTRSRAAELTFTEHLSETRQVLVQKAGRSPDFVKSPIELIGRRVHVRSGSPYFERLKNLSEEIGGRIKVITVPGHISTEDLIDRVHRQEIEFTIADEPTALVNRAHYSDLDVSIAISFPQRIAWVVHRESPELLAEINRWIRSARKSNRLAALYNKYYNNPRAFSERIESEFYSGKGDKISVFDDQVRKAAAGIGWDWRLLASLIYQESHFIPTARSWAGAQGLMQLMPATALQFGVTALNDPAQNLKAGTAYLALLEEIWKAISAPEERLKFVLGSYNAGPGHIEDARFLADRDGKKNDQWSDVAPYLLKLRNPETYNQEGVKFGYLRGDEPFNYVVEILDRYEQYKKLIPEARARLQQLKKEKPKEL